MKIKVHMLAFERRNDDGTPKIREVEVPEAFTQRIEPIGDLLEMVWFHGQNENQPQQMCSVSMGDVIEYEESFYLITALGFRRVPRSLFEEMIHRDPSTHQLECLKMKGDIT